MPDPYADLSTWMAPKTSSPPPSQPSPPSTEPIGINPFVPSFTRFIENEVVLHGLCLILDANVGCGGLAPLLETSRITYKAVSEIIFKTKREHMVLFDYELMGMNEAGKKGVLK